VIVAGRVDLKTKKSPGGAKFFKLRGTQTHRGGSELKRFFTRWIFAAQGDGLGGEKGIFQGKKKNPVPSIPLLFFWNKTKTRQRPGFYWHGTKKNPVAFFDPGLLQDGPRAFRANGAGKGVFKG